MNRNEKRQAVDFIRDAFARSQAVIFADYKGVHSNAMNELRQKLRPLDVSFRVLKNNLLRVALKNSSKEEAVKGLVGPTAALFSYGDPASAAKLLEEFSKKVEVFSVKGGFLADRPVGREELQALANLPSREILLSQLASVLNAPIRNFVSVLHAVPRSFVLVLNAISEKKNLEEGATKEVKEGLEKD